MSHNYSLIRVIVKATHVLALYVNETAADIIARRKITVCNVRAHVSNNVQYMMHTLIGQMILLICNIIHDAGMTSPHQITRVHGDDADFILLTNAASYVVQHPTIH